MSWDLLTRAGEAALVGVCNRAPIPDGVEAVGRHLVGPLAPRGGFFWSEHRYLCDHVTPAFSIPVPRHSTAWVTLGKSLPFSEPRHSSL